MWSGKDGDRLRTQFQRGTSVTQPERVQQTRNIDERRGSEQKERDRKKEVVAKSMKRNYWNCRHVQHRTDAPFHGMIMKFAWNLCSISSGFLPTCSNHPSTPPSSSQHSTLHQPSTYTASNLTRPKPISAFFFFLLKSIFLEECSYAILEVVR